MDTDDIKDLVRARYGGIAAAASANVTGAAPCCAPDTGCCGPASALDAQASRLGYSEAEIAAVPEGANLGLGCGNPQAIAALRPGEVLLDLGSGAGFDCLLAARQVGPTGHVIGVDMTHEMSQGARQRCPGGRRQCRIPAGRTGAPAGGRRHRRRHHLQLRDQPGARQGAGVPRGVPCAEAGRPAGDQRRGEHCGAAAGTGRRQGAAVRLRRRGGAISAIEDGWPPPGSLRSASR